MSKPNLNTFAPRGDAAHAASPPLPQFPKGSHVAVVGAGAFGGWSALHLLRKGFKVTLIDAWGAGNSRSSSGDETRVIRSTYGANETYFDLNVRALELWKENQLRFGRTLFYNSGVLWFCYEKETPLIDDSIPFAARHQMNYEYLTQKDLATRYPQVHADDLHHAYFDPYGGYLKARESTQLVQEAFVNEGGHFIQQAVRVPKLTDTLDNISLGNGNSVRADFFLFACGSWLGQMFPEVLGTTITCTKQEVYYLGVPREDAEAFENMPVWVDVDGQDFYYGIPGNAHRGFKIGVDIRGPLFDPSVDERTLTPDALTKARTFIAHRFPKLATSPLIENRVCPYENSPDGNFIFDLLGETSNAFILGGGSGHGFKHGPSLGELVADVLSGEKNVPSLFRLSKK